MAEQTVDQIVRHLGREPIPSVTANRPLLTPDAATPFSAIVPPACTEAAVKHYVHREWAVHLDDVMLRRSGWHYYHRDSSQLAERVASWMAELLDWSPARRAEEFARYRAAVGSATSANRFAA